MSWDAMIAGDVAAARLRGDELHGCHCGMTYAAPVGVRLHITHRPAEHIVTIEGGRHRRTDPACTRYRRPATTLGRLLHDRARGRACNVCRPRVRTIGRPSTGPEITDLDRQLMLDTWQARR